MSQARQIHIRHLRQLLGIAALLHSFHILQRVYAGANQHGLEAAVVGKDYVGA